METHSDKAREIVAHIILSRCVTFVTYMHVDGHRHVPLPPDAQPFVSSILRALKSRGGKGDDVLRARVAGLAVVALWQSLICHLVDEFLATRDLEVWDDLIPPLPKSELEVSAPDWEAAIVAWEGHLVRLGGRKGRRGWCTGRPACGVVPGGGIGGRAAPCLPQLTSRREV